MKLHLPKQLFTALLAAITLVAPAAWGTTGYIDEPTKSGNFFADDYTFVFVWDGSDSNKIGSVLTFYRGSAINDTYGYNAWTLNTTTKSLTVGRGKAVDTVDDATGIGIGTNFEYASGINDSRAFTIEAGVVYRVSVTGGNSAMTPTITKVADAVTTSGSSYNGNMNGQTDITVASNSNYMVATDSIIWKSASSSESSLSTIDNWTTVQGAGVSEVTDKNLIFDANSAVIKEVDISDSTRVASIKVYGDYTFGGAGSLTVTGDLNIAAGASATFNVATTLSGTVTNNGSLTLSAARIAGNLDIRGEGSFIFSTDLTLDDNTLTATATSITVNGAMHANGGNITLGDGSNSGTLTVNRVEVADAASGQSTFNVESDYTLKVTGSANTIQNGVGQYKTNSFVVSEWGNSTTMNVKGTILAENAAVMTGDSGVTINIENGGTLATKGLGRSNPGKTAVSTVNLKEGGTLVLGDMGMDYDGKVTANISGGTIGIAAESVTIADALNITGALSVDTTQYSYGESGLTQGTTGGKLVFGSDLTGGGTLTATGAGSLEFGAISSGVSITTGTAGVNFTGTLSMGDGTTFTVGTGAYTLDASDITTFIMQAGATIVDKDGNTATNGFAAGARTVIDGGTIDGEFTLTYDGETYTINNENRTFGPADSIYLDTWYLNSGSSTLSEIYAESSSATVSAAGGTTLNVDTALSTGIELTGDATMNISEGVTLAASAITTNDNTVTLDGSGTYSINSGNATKVTVAEGWTGKVELFGQSALDLTSYGHSGSTISLKDYVGYFINSGNSTKEIDANLVLTNTNLAAVELTNGYTGGVYNFNGSISGDGNFIVNTNLGAGNSMTFNFNGDTSEWIGKMEVVKGEHNVKYTGATTIDNLTIQARGGNAAKMNLSIENISAAVEVNSTITNNDNNTVNLTTNAAQGVLFNNNVNVTQLTVANGSSAMINADGKTITAGKVQISQRNATLSNVTVQDSSISATADGTKGSISNAQLTQLQADATFTIEDMTLTNTTITAATTETRVNLSNVSGDATLDKGKFHMQGQLPVALVSAGGSDVEFKSDTLSGLTLNTTDSSASLVVDLGDLSCLTLMGPGQYNLTITLSGFTMAAYDGLATKAGLVFADDSWLGSLLDQAQNASVKMTIAQAEAGAAAAAEGGAATGVTYSIGNVDTVITITGLNVPEPTTSTLSLLALAALAARRRRNA